MVSRAGIKEQCLGESLEFLRETRNRVQRFIFKFSGLGFELRIFERDLDFGSGIERVPPLDVREQRRVDLAARIFLHLLPERDV